MAGNNNQLSRYGAISRVLPYLGPQGQVFIVAGSSQTFLADLMSSFPSDKGGVSRVFTTLTAASAMTVSGRGDVIVVCPGYTETVTANGGIELNSAEVTIVGLGNGTQRPTISFTTTTAADINFDAVGVVMENFIFDMTGIDALVGPLDINAAGCVVRKSKIITGNATNQTTLAVICDANAGDFEFSDNVVVGTTDAGTTAVVQLTGGDNIRILRNSFQGAYSSGIGAISNITTACTNLVIEDNAINNQTASSTKAITCVGGSTGQIRKNHMQILSGTAPITAAAMSWVGANYYAAVIATAGTLI